jgi:hypothetical protein
MIKKWFKKKFREWSKESWEYGTDRAELGKVVSASSLYETRQLNSDAVLNFTVYNAVGGKVVEFRYHDRKSDHNLSQMYVIGRDEDFGEKIAKIATLEVLKQ